MAEPETVTCPRCQASGRDVQTPPHGVCPGCGTTWERGALGQMIAMPGDSP